MRGALVLISALALFETDLSAIPLEIVEVSAPAINCIFVSNSDCRITVNDSTAPITLPASSGEGFLQSRVAAPGEPGTEGQVEDGLAPGFRRDQGPALLEFETADGRDREVTQQYELLTTREKGTFSVPGVITVEPRGGRGRAESFQLLLPLGPDAGPDLGSIPTEPLPPASDDPDFGPGPCGDAAESLWAEHVEGAARLRLPPSPVKERFLKGRADRCRQLSPSFGGLCGNFGAAAWADCFLRGGRDCSSVAQEAIDRCHRWLGPTLGGILGGLRDDLIDLDLP